MSDERRWRLSGQIIKAGPHVNSSQPVDVMPVAEHEAALARVEGERAEAWRMLMVDRADRDALRRERDALRAQVKALTDQVDAVLAANRIGDKTILWEELAALAAARDAAAANPPDQPAS